MSESTSQIKVDRSRCVLCGGPNDCALAKVDVQSKSRGGADARSEAPCWCVGESFPLRLLEAANAKDAGASCVCRACLEKAAAENDSPATERESR